MSTMAGGSAITIGVLSGAGFATLFACLVTTGKCTA
jgi:hypothetical protein